MNIVEKFDLALKQYEGGAADTYYDVPHNGVNLKKYAYMTKDEWLSFLDAMPAVARKEYGDGGGDELSEKNGRPPKMASYGSSSRMIYKLSGKK